MGKVVLSQIYLIGLLDIGRVDLSFGDQLQSSAW